MAPSLPNTPSYLGDFNPAVYLFMETKIVYGKPLSIQPALKDLTTGQENGWHTQMRCLKPASPSAFIPYQYCTPSWINIGGPNLNRLQAYIEGLTGAEDISTVFEGMQGVNAGENDANDMTKSLLTELQTSLKGPNSLYNLQLTLYNVCVNGVTLEAVDPNDNIIKDTSNGTSTRSRSLLGRIAETITTKTSFPIPSGFFPFLTPNVASRPTLSLTELLASGITQYNKSWNNYNRILQDIINANQALDTNVATNHKTVTALQQKIDLAYKVLHAEGNKLRDLTQNYANSRAQTDQSQRNRVAIGIPYLNPFFTMSQRNYVIMMLCFIVMLVVGILVYAFIGRTRLHGDVLGGRSS